MKTDEDQDCSTVETEIISKLKSDEKIQAESIFAEVCVFVV